MSATHRLNDAADAGVITAAQPVSTAIGHQARLRELAALVRNEPGGSPLQFSAAVPPVKVKLSILMAAYNEEQTIARVVQAVLGVDYPCEMELIVVNDGSKDRTTELLEQLNDPRVVVHHHPVNMGKGAALKTAVKLATGTHVVPFDADQEYLPEDLPRLLEPIIKGRCNVVYGTRMFGVNTVHRSYRYAVGNRFLSRLANVLFDSCISDLHTCLKLIPLDMVRALTLTENGFGLDTEITASLLRHGVRPFEVPISYYSRSHAQGKKINWRDAVDCIQILFRVRLRSASAQTECFKAASFRPYQVPAFSYRPATQLVPSRPAVSWTLDAQVRSYAEADGRVEAVQA